MRNFAFLVLMTAACGSDPTPRPVIDVVSPTAGDYGTKVAVTGHHLENQRVTASGPNGEDVTLFSAPIAPKGTEVVSLGFPFAFPAEGEMKLGDVSLGAFVPTWKAGPASALGTASVRDAVWAGSAVVAIVGGASGVAFLVYDGVTARSVPTDVAGTYGDVALAALGAKVTALLFDGVKVDQIALDGTTVTHVPFGAIPSDVQPVTIGADAAPFVVGLKAGSLVRLRAGAPDATIEGTPITLPGKDPIGFGFGTAVGGTIVYVWGEHRNTNLVDDTTAFFVSGLAPSETAFPSGFPLGEYDDDFDSIVMKRVRGAVQAGYCAIQTGAFDKPKKNCGAMTTLDGTSKLAVTDAAFARSPGGIASAGCEGSTVQVGVDTKKETALYPCLDAQALVYDAAGAPHVLAVSGTKLYAASRR